MINIIKELQNLGSQLAPLALLITGFVLVWVGLCMWLGGLRWLKFFAGLAAVIIGYITAYFLTDRQMYFLFGIPLFFGIAAIYFEKATMILFAGILIALVVNLSLVWSTLNEPARWQNPPEPPAAGQESTVGQSLEAMSQYTAWIGNNIFNAAKSLGSVNGAVYGVVVLAIAALGLVSPRGICALSCAFFGAAMMIDGMFLLLLYKGSKPADIILNNPGLFGLIVTVMILFGALINLAVAPAKAPKKPKSNLVVE